MLFHPVLLNLKGYWAYLKKKKKKVSYKDAQIRHARSSNLLVYGKKITPTKYNKSLGVMRKKDMGRNGSGRSRVRSPSMS